MAADANRLKAEDDDDGEDDDVDEVTEDAGVEVLFTFLQRIVKSEWRQIASFS